MNFKRYCACVLQHSVLFAILFQSILSSFFCFFFSVFVLNSTHVPGKIDQKCNNCPCVRVRLYVMGVKQSKSQCTYYATVSIQIESTLIRTHKQNKCRKRRKKTTNELDRLEFHSKHPNVEKRPAHKKLFNFCSFSCCVDFFFFFFRCRYSVFYGVYFYFFALLCGMTESQQERYMNNKNNEKSSIFVANKIDSL